MKFTCFDLTQAVENTSHAETYQHLFDQVEIAENGGMDAYYITEHHFDPGYNISPSPNVILGALSQRTEKIRLGVMTTVLPYHHPVRVASEIRELDLLTGGRLDVAFGRGAIRLEQIGWGVPRNETSERFEATFLALMRMLTEEKIDKYSSPWWSGENITILPDATQKPYPPLWLTAVSETSSYKAGRLGLHCCTAFRSQEERQVSMANFRAGWEEFSPDGPPGQYQSMHMIFVAETESEARKWAQPHIEGWLGHFVKLLSDRPKKNEEASYETHKRVNTQLLESSFDGLIADNRLIFGTPAQCIDQLERVMSDGIDVFQGYFQFGNLDYDASNRSLKLFCDEVMPHFESHRS